MPAPVEGDDKVVKRVETSYVRITAPKGREEFRKGGKVNGELLPARPDEIIVPEGDEKTSFKPDRDADGNFKVEEVSFLLIPTRKRLCYRDSGNRIMEEGNLGTVAHSRTGQMLLNVLLHLLHLLLWFVCTWMLLRFQVGHSVLIALACWLAVTFCGVGPAFDRAEAAARAVPAVRAF